MAETVKGKVLTDNRLNAYGSDKGLWEPQRSKPTKLKHRRDMVEEGKEVQGMNDEQTDAGDVDITAVPKYFSVLRDQPYHNNVTVMLS